MFSQNIDITNLGITNVVIRQRENIYEKKFLKLDIMNQDGLIYIMVTEYAENYGPLMIKNTLDNISVIFKQLIKPKEMDFPFDKLKPKSHTIYSWDYALGEKTMVIEFLSEEYEKTKPLKLNSITNINETYQVVLIPKNINEKPLVVIIIIKLYKEMKIIEFMNAELRTIKYDMEVLNDNQLESLNIKKKDLSTSIKLILKIENIGISFIQNTSIPFNELIFVCFKGFNFIAIDSKNRIRTYQIRLKNFVINNNSSDQVRFPVVISSVEKFSENNPKFLLNLILKKHLDSEHVI